jgi:two-component system OmpR family response regulator
MTALIPGLPAQLNLIIVDGEAGSVSALEQQLRELGCASFTAASAMEARACLADQPVDIALINLELPDDSGLNLLRWARSRSEPCEVILLAAEPTVATAVQAMREGAADYLSKPVALDTLASALQRVGRRLRRARAPAVPLPGTAELRPARSGNQFEIGPVRLDADRLVLTVNGQPIEATPSELGIFQCLCRNPNRVVTAQELVAAIRGYQVEGRQAHEILRPHVSNLRRKLLAIDLEADVVRTVRGVGYILKLPRGA